VGAGDPSGPEGVAAELAGVVVLVALVVGAGSLVGRFRRARGIERQQLRWLAWGAVLAAMFLVAAITELALDDDTPLFQAAIGACLVSLTLATGAAILRYRLYDIDRILSRTLAYGLLTVLLGLGYAGVVLGLGRFLPEGSSLVVAAATLAVAAVFQPLRRRVQAAVDRRFNRRHDAARTIAAFSTRLRDQVDLDALHGELLAVVDQTMQPTHASLWLRPQARSGPGAALVQRQDVVTPHHPARVREEASAARVVDGPLARHRPGFLLRLGEDALHRVQVRVLTRSAPQPQHGAPIPSVRISRSSTSAMRSPPPSMHPVG
jgi:hypothetical protein